MAFDPNHLERLCTYDEMVELLAEVWGCDLEEAEYWVDRAIENGVITRHRIH